MFSVLTCLSPFHHDLPFPCPPTSFSPLSFQRCTITSAHVRGLSPHRSPRACPSTVLLTLSSRRHGPTPQRAGAEPTLGVGGGGREKEGSGTECISALCTSFSLLIATFVFVCLCVRLPPPSDVNLAACLPLSPFVDCLFCVCCVLCCLYLLFIVFTAYVCACTCLCVCVCRSEPHTALPPSLPPPSALACRLSLCVSLWLCLSVCGRLRMFGGRETAASTTKQRMEMKDEAREDTHGRPQM